MNNTNLFIINGLPKSGKDTFANLVQAINCSEKEVVNVSSVDDVKTAYKLLGWDGQKSPEDRKNLHQLKKMVDLRFNYTVNKIFDLVRNNRDKVFIYHVRELDNIAKIKQMFSGTIFGVKSVYVDRPSVSTDQSNNSDIEAGLDAQSYDILIDNSGTKEELISKAREFCEIHLEVC